MSFKLTLVTAQFAICVTDRRLVTPDRKLIVTERSNKLTLFQCQDAHGFITYSGIGSDFERKTPSDWIADHPKIGSLPLDDAIATIKINSDRRLNLLRQRGIDVRHSFVIAGYKMGLPFILLLSNLESFDEAEDKDIALPELVLSGRQMSLLAGNLKAFVLLATGASPRRKKRIKEKIVDAWKAGATPKALSRQMVKTVKDVAYHQGRLGSVGTSVQSALVGPFSDFNVNMHVPGGATLQEGPNFIGRATAFRDVHFEVSENARRGSRYIRLRESPKF